MNFLVSFVVVFCLFTVCLIISYVIKNFDSNKKAPSKSDDAKIFYITNFRKPKKKPKKTVPNVALKGAIISPKEFRRYYAEDSKTTNDNQ